MRTTRQTKVDMMMCNTMSMMKETMAMSMMMCGDMVCFDARSELDFPNLFFWE